MSSFARLLETGKWTVNLGRHSVRLAGPCGQAKFESTDDGFILADGIDGDAPLTGAKELSSHLTTQGLRHRLEVYERDELVAYLHHQWPADDRDE